jgi:hypothetical protein
MVIMNAAVGVAVIGSFGVLLVEFLEETRAPRPGGEDDETREEGA